MTDATDILEHLVGSSQKSLGIVPALYFYTDSGRHVRSLLYGLIYWLLFGTEEQILRKKRIFCGHRRALETILLKQKGDIIGGITRKTGSGPEVTSQTAKYYQGLLELLIKHKDTIESDDFNAEYGDFIKHLGLKPSETPSSLESKGRYFSEKQQSVARLRDLLETQQRCGICGGIYDPTSDLQHDHILEWSKGGKTSSANLQLTHPFCNNDANKQEIKKILEGQPHKLPDFLPVDITTGSLQLSFLDDEKFLSF